MSTGTDDIVNAAPQPKSLLQIWSCTITHYNLSVASLGGGGAERPGWHPPGGDAQMK